MDRTIEDFIKNLAIQQLMKMPLGEKLQQASQMISSLQEHLEALYMKNEAISVTGLKAVTVLTFAVMKKIAEGKKLSDLDDRDWKEIAEAVSAYSVFLDGEQYSISIFRLYEKYITASASAMEQLCMSPMTYEAVIRTAEELHDKEVQLMNGEITETGYTEDCLWISLDAMIKLIASAVSMPLGEQARDLTQAITSYAFEYGRLMLYRKEQQLVDSFIQSQYHLDDELEQKYAQYLTELEDQTERFYTLVDNAFAPDFRTAFLHSAILAKAAGVKESDILLSTDDIDRYFID